MIQSLKKGKSDCKDNFSLQLFQTPKCDTRYLVCYNMETHVCKAKSSVFSTYYSRGTNNAKDLYDVPKIMKDQLVNLTTSLALNIDSTSLKIEEITAEWIINEAGIPIPVSYTHLTLPTKRIV